MKKIIALLLIASSSIGLGMEDWTVLQESVMPSRPGKVRIVNDSDWKVEVKYHKSGTLINKVLSPHEESLLGDVETVQGVSIKTYGELYGALAQEHPIDISRMYEKKDQNVTIHIKTGWLGNWEPKLVWGSWEAKAAIPASGNPFDAFQGVKDAQKRGLLKEGQPVPARYILGVGQYATKKDIEQAHKELSLKWHPDKHKDNKVFAEEVSQLINNAKDELLEQLERGKIGH